MKSCFEYDGSATMVKTVNSIKRKESHIVQSKIYPTTHRYANEAERAAYPLTYVALNKHIARTIPIGELAAYQKPNGENVVSRKILHGLDPIGQQMIIDELALHENKEVRKFNKMMKRK